MPPVAVKDDIFWVGAVDWQIRDFHGYSTQKGSSYNAYLVMDERIALFDTVKNGFQSDLLHNIRRLTDPEKIDYIIVNHVEMDHSGSLPEIIDRVKPVKIFCSKKGKQALLDHFKAENWPLEVVKSGDELNLGKRTVTFLETRMLHWPDSMFSYLKEDKLLISSDAFGQHWATSERFADEVDEPQLFRHAAKYFANILMLYAPLILKLLGTVQEMALEIDTIAPDHGLIWRRNPEKIINAYAHWSRQECSRKALIIYDTMWKSTDLMAKAIADGLLQEGISIQLLDLKNNHRSDIMTEALEAKALIFGSATLNNSMLPTMADMLNYIGGLRPANRIGAAFGSYGWSGEAVKDINKALEAMKVSVVDPGMRVKYVPTHEDLHQCVELGRKIGKAINNDFQ